MALVDINPLFKIFQNFRSHKSELTEKAIEQNTQGVSAFVGDTDAIISSQLNDSIRSQTNPEEYNSGSYGFGIQGTAFEGTFASKKVKIAKFNEMLKYPEISQATSIVVNEAINEDDNNMICNLRFKNNVDDELPDSVKKVYMKTFNKIHNEIYNLQNNGDTLFEKFLVETELYIEFILNDAQDDIIGFQVLPPYTILPVYGSNNNTLTGYVQYSDIIFSNSSTRFAAHGLRDKNFKYRAFAPNQIAYANSGKYGSSIYDIKGYFDSVVKTYHHIKTIDDALAIYRWVRAPETRLWNVFTGKMAPSKQQAFLKQVITKFSKVSHYNFETGEIDQKANIKSLIEDLWFTKDESGNKTEVETLSGGMNLGEIDDVKYYIGKLYKGLKIPSGRVASGETASERNVRQDTIITEEQQFSKFIAKLHRNFKAILTTPLETLLKAYGIEDKYISNKYYDIEFTTLNKWKILLDAEMWKVKFEKFDLAKDYVYDAEDNPKGWISKEYAIKNIAGWSDTDWETNKMMLEEEKKSAKPADETQDEFGNDMNDEFGSDMNDEFGGSDNEDTNLQEAEDEINTELAMTPEDEDI